MENTNNDFENDNTNKTVFISGLPYNSTEEEIKAFFEGCGGIKEFKIPKYQDTGRNIGYGHITFKKKKAVQKVIIPIIQALELNGKNLGTRYINVALSKGENPEKSNKIFKFKKQEMLIQWIYQMDVQLSL